MYTHCNIIEEHLCLWIHIISNEPLLTEFKGPNVSYGPHFFHLQQGPRKES